MKSTPPTPPTPQQLPSLTAILDAFDGHVTGRLPGESPVCRWAADLIAVHRVAGIRPERAEIIADRRREIIATVDAWAGFYLSLQTAAAGPVLDQLAEAHAHVEHAICTDGTESVPWSQMYSCGDRWNKLVAETRPRPHGNMTRATERLETAEMTESGGAVSAAPPPNSRQLEP